MNKFWEIAWNDFYCGGDRWLQWLMLSEFEYTRPLNNFRAREAMRDEKYIRANNIGQCEGLESAALYHEGIAERQLRIAEWDEAGNPANGPALAVCAHKKYAQELREMKP